MKHGIDPTSTYLQQVTGKGGKKAKKQNTKQEGKGSDVSASTRTAIDKGGEGTGDDNNVDVDNVNVDKGNVDNKVNDEDDGDCGIRAEEEGEEEEDELMDDFNEAYGYQVSSTNLDEE